MRSRRLSILLVSFTLLSFSAISYGGLCDFLLGKKKHEDTTREVFSGNVIAQFRDMIVSGQSLLDYLPAQLIIDFSRMTIPNFKGLEIKMMRKGSQLDQAAPADHPAVPFSHEARSFEFENIPSNIRLIEKGKLLYYGRPTVGVGEATGLVRSMFRSGRRRHDEGHFDVATHQHATSRVRSGFIQTTESITTALNFGRQAGATAKRLSRVDHGVVFVIDPAHLQLVRVNQLLEYAEIYNGYKEEREVLIFKQLAPTRVVGAFIFQHKRTEGQGFKPMSFFINPNYQSANSM